MKQFTVYFFAMIMGLALLIGPIVEPVTGQPEQANTGLKRAAVPAEFYK